MVVERPVFENEEWLVTESGLEHKTTGYLIEGESLANRRSDGLWTWPMQMAEKSWCAMRPFMEAFIRAAAVYNIRTGAELEQSFTLARQDAAAWPYGMKRSMPPAPLTKRTLHPMGPNPILWEPGRSEKSVRDQDASSHGKGPRKHALKGARVFSAKARTLGPQADMGRATALPWRTSYRLEGTGTKLVRLLQAAWTMR